MVILGIILLILIAMTVTGVYIYKKLKNPENKSVNQIYESKDGRFVIEGKKRRFKICKSNNIEFLVENGQIVACKDKRISDEFKFYGGKENGIVQ